MHLSQKEAILHGTMGSRMRKNKSQRDQRRAHITAKTSRLTVDTETGSTHLRHRVDLKTGMYRGVQVIDIDGKAVKQAAKDSARSAKNSEANSDKAELVGKE